MIDASAFVGPLAARGFRLFTGVPCSYLTPFINFVVDAPDLRYVPAANEGDAVAIATGAELGGTHAVVLLQNSGLGNAVSPLTSLTAVFELPVLLIVTWRGEPAGAPDEPQHALMGAITEPLLELLAIPHERFPEDTSLVAPALERAIHHMRVVGTPYAFLMPRGSVAPYPVRARPEARRVHPDPVLEPWSARRPTRGSALAAIRSAARDGDVLIATTGHTGRELYAAGDHPNQLYLVGAMGCASSLALGLCIARPERRVVVIDGDGAALMRLGALATIGYERPTNLVHVLLDNEAHDSTGAQSTVAHTADLAFVAAACGYPRVVRARNDEELAAAVAGDEPLLTFVHMKTVPGSPHDLPRPTVRPAEVARRLRRFVSAGST
jgi:phosphonopyruvate decarboxylase